MAKNYVGLTDTGKKRTNNEDAFIAEVAGNQFVIACVIDGLGGYEGGEVAAALAREAILKNLSAQIGADLELQMKQAFINAGNSILEAKKAGENDPYRHMACVATLAVANLAHNTFYYAHVGDTRLYLLRDKSLIKITKDQSFVGFLEDNGRLTEHEAMKHPKRNEINKALGFDNGAGSEEYIETGSSPFLPGDILLLCSDGLSDMISSSIITTILNTSASLPQKAIALINAANDAGGNDNITVVLVQNDKEKLAEIAVKPAAKKSAVQQPMPAVTAPVIATFPTETNQANRSATVSVLSVLLLLSLAALAWFYVQTKNSGTTASTVVAMEPAVAEKRNAAEQAFMDSINRPLLQSVNLTAGSDAQPVVISDTIFINKDSLTIYGNGAIITSDSLYKGPAFVLSDNCSYIVFDSLLFVNFDIAIWARQTGIHLRKVRFQNCKIPIVQQFEFPSGIPVSGSIADAFFTPEISRK